MRWRAASRLAATTVVLAALTGCGSSTEEKTTMTSPVPISAAEQEYREMLRQVQDALTTDHGVGSWRRHREELTGFVCDDDAGVGISLNLGSADAIDEAHWPAALDTVQRVVAEHGFTELEAVVDEPGDHSVRITNPEGGYVTFGTEQATVLTVLSGCHPDDRGPAADPEG